MIVKIHKNFDNKRLLSICDSEILGKKFSEGKLQLDLSGNFYKGNVKNEEEIKEMIKYCDLLNVVGKKSIDFLIINNIINKNDVLYIKKIPYVICIIK